MKALGWFVVMVAMTAVSAVMAAWLWNMVLPDLFAVRRIGIVDAFGLCLLVDFFTYTAKGKPDDRPLGTVFRDAFVESVSMKVMFLLLGLAYGWLS